MKISDLIDRLNKLKHNNGDLPVYYDSDGFDTRATSVEIEEHEDGGHSGCDIKALPQRVLIR